MDEASRKSCTSKACSLLLALLAGPEPPLSDFVFFPFFSPISRSSIASLIYGRCHLCRHHSPNLQIFPSMAEHVQASCCLFMAVVGVEQCLNRKLESGSSARFGAMAASNDGSFGHGRGTLMMVTMAMAVEGHLPAAANHLTKDGGGGGGGGEGRISSFYFFYSNSADMCPLITGHD